MPRNRDDDDDYDDEPRASKKPRRRDDDDDDDFDDAPRVNKNPPSGIEGMYANTNFAILIIFSLCCNWMCFLPLILSIVAYSTATDEKAKNNAKICLIISSVMVVLGVIGNIVRFALVGLGQR